MNKKIKGKKRKTCYVNINNKLRKKKRKKNKKWRAKKKNEDDEWECGKMK